MWNVQVEPLQRFIDDALGEILEEHWQELALNKDRVPLDPQLGEYRKREADGSLLVMSMRTDDDAEELVGYFLGFIAPGLHYQTCLTCTMDIFYVRPKFRDNLLAGRRLMRAVEKELRLRGVNRWFVGTKCHMDVARLFESLKFQLVEKYYSKWLGD